MAQFAPQYSLFEVIGRFRKAITIAFWIILALSILPPILKFVGWQSNIDDVVNSLNIIALIVFFTLEISVDFFLVPQAESKRRDDFIDNSFGSAFTPVPSTDYFDTHGIPVGLYRAASNLFENCFFTYSLTKSITTQKVIVPAITFTIIIVLAYFGFKEVPFALSLLQAFFSANLLGDLIRHLVFVSRLGSIYSNWISLFQRSDFKENIAKYQNDIYRQWLQYEALLSSISPEIPDDVFKKHNIPLTSEWDKLKQRYNIN